MKIIASLKYFITAIFIITFTLPTSAQIGADLETVVNDFQAAYNRGDYAAIGKVFTSNAVRVNTDGTTINGAEKISQTYKSGFVMSTLQTTNTVTNIVFVNANEASVTGTYSINGNIKSNGQEIFSDGVFENTFIKENGVWKISRMQLKDTQ
jgi:ketosteroid isomerase-like protein